MITIKRLRNGKWESVVRIGGLLPKTEAFASESVARDWADQTEHEMRSIRARLPAIALGNRGKPKARRQRPPQDLAGLITPAIERFLANYGCAGELPFETPAPRTAG